MCSGNSSAQERIRSGSYSRCGGWPTVFCLLLALLHGQPAEFDKHCLPLSLELVQTSPQYTGSTC